jgi:hypothetical protein
LGNLQLWRVSWALISLPLTPYRRRSQLRLLSGAPHDFLKLRQLLATVSVGGFFFDRNLIERLTALYSGPATLSTLGVM